jgi:hypothetical protein
MAAAVMAGVNIFLYILSNKIYKQLLLGYLGFVQNKARSLNTGAHCLKMANVKVNLVSDSERSLCIKTAILEITVDKLSVVKDQKSYQSIRGPGSPSSRNSGKKNELMSTKLKKRTRSKKSRSHSMVLETEERDILTNKDREEVEIPNDEEQNSPDQDGEKIRKKTMSTDISRLNKSQKSPVNKVSKRNQFRTQTSIMQKLEYSSNSSSSSEEHKEASREINRAAKSIKSILVQPSNRKYGNIITNNSKNIKQAKK